MSGEEYEISETILDQTIGLTPLIARGGRIGLHSVKISDEKEPVFYFAAIFCVKTNGEDWSPEDPEGRGQPLEILVSSIQFQWLTRQSDYLGVSKQQLVSEALEEWLCRNHPLAVIQDPAVAVRSAIDEFMRRHEAEFL